METLYTYSDPPSEKHLERTCRILEDNGVICYPVGANWAFGCDARSSKALDKIHLLKPNHPKDKSFSLLCSSISMASEYGHVDSSLYRLVKKMWPGPYTIIVPTERSLPRQLKDKRKVVGLRIPECSMVRALIEMFGRPLATTSVPPKEDGSFYSMGYEIESEFSHMLDILLDLGEELTGEESTIVSFENGIPEVIRQGLGDTSMIDS